MDRGFSTVDCNVTNPVLLSTHDEVFLRLKYSVLHIFSTSSDENRLNTEDRLFENINEML